MLKELLSKENLFIMVFGIACGSLYYTFYLSPRDAKLYSILDCMEGNRSKESYDRCAAQQR